MSYKSSSKFSCYNFIVCFDSVAPVNFFTILGIQHVTMAQTVKSLPAIWENWVQSLDPEDPLEKDMSTHSSILAWALPWTEEPGGLQFMGLQRIRHNLPTKQQQAPNEHWTSVLLGGGAPSSEPQPPALYLTLLMGPTYGNVLKNYEMYWCIFPLTSKRWRRISEELFKQNLSLK